MKWFPALGLLLLAACGSTPSRDFPSNTQPPTGSPPVSPPSQRDTTAPSVALVPSVTRVTSASPLVLSASASDNSRVSRVDFYHGNQLIVSDTVAPFQTSLGFNATMNGTHTFTARAFDEAGNQNEAFTSVMVDITSSAPPPSRDSTPPNISLSAAQTNITSSGAIEVSAAAADDSGTVTRVDFYDGGALFASDTSAPFEASFTADRSKNGTRTLTARAYDAAGNVATSSAVNVNVNIAAPRETTPPSVVLSAETLQVTEPREVLLSADASDASGIDRVEFYRNGKLVHREAVAPYLHHHPFADSRQNGEHKFEAIAYDKTGNAKTSQTVIISVNIPLPPDTQPPTVNLTASPAEVGASAVVALLADARDNREVDRVEFYKGARLVATAHNAPYKANSVVLEGDAGQLVFTAKAFDAAGNVTLSAPAVVNVRPQPAFDPAAFTGDWSYWVAQTEYYPRYEGYVTWTGHSQSGGIVTVTGRQFECNDAALSNCTENGEAIVTYNGNSIRAVIKHHSQNCSPVPPHECWPSYGTWVDGEDSDGRISNSNGVSTLSGTALLANNKVFTGVPFEMRSRR